MRRTFTSNRLIWCVELLGQRKPLSVPPWSGGAAVTFTTAETCHLWPGLKGKEKGIPFRESTDEWCEAAVPSHGGEGGG